MVRYNQQDRARDTVSTDEEVKADRDRGRSDLNKRSSLDESSEDSLSSSRSSSPKPRRSELPLLLVMREPRIPGQEPRFCR